MPSQSDPALVFSTSGTVHIRLPDAELTTGHPDLSEREKMLCGATVTQNKDLPIDGNRLTDIYRRGDLCDDCLAKLQERNSTIPMFISNGELSISKH